MIGEKPSEKIFQLYAKSPFKEEIHFLTEINDEKLKLAYAAASMLLFPSIAEGFGWPLVEAMASGCPVITTNEAPMTEVADKAGFYISKKPTNKMQNKQWSFESAYAINFLVSLSEKEHSAITRSGILNSKRFSAKTNLDSIEDIYTQVLQKSCGKVNAQGNIKSEAVGS
ncbi:MAG: mannosyl transferase [Daejeonella sp.]|nr:mannosyl transferase [Daejeonella sp.]